MDKAPDAFRTISEVAEELDLPQHVLRFWETRFSHIKPLKRAGGRRYYRPDDVDLVRGIRHLLYGKGFTIKGVQRILKEQGLRYVQTIWRDAASDTLPASIPSAEITWEQVTQSLDWDENTEAPSHSIRAAVAAQEALAADVLQARATMQSIANSSQTASAEVLDDLLAEHVQQLQSALETLTECRKLLSASLETENDNSVFKQGSVA
jgi:DNA-binding transcriptional MerR regulator